MWNHTFSSYPITQTEFTISCCYETTMVTACIIMVNCFFSEERSKTLPGGLKTAPGPRQMLSLTSGLPQLTLGGHIHVNKHNFWQELVGVRLNSSQSPADSSLCWQIRPFVKHKVFIFKSELSGWTIGTDKSHSAANISQEPHILIWHHRRGCKVNYRPI